MLPECTRLILDQGLRIEGSLDSRNSDFAVTVALLVSGEQLPEECDAYSPARVLTLQITTEAHGSQRLSRISAISVDAYRTDQFWLTWLRSQ